MNKTLRIILFFSFLILIFTLFGIIINENIVNDKIKEAKLKISKLRENKNIPQDFIEFPKYYINLDRSEERRKNMEKEIQFYGLENIKKVKAFDGRNIDNIKEGKLDNYEYKNHKDRKCTKSELAITMSHIKAINQVFEDKHEYAMIMEDDNEMTLIPHWDITITEMIEMIPEDCDILLLCTRKNKKDIKLYSNDHKNRGLNGVNYIITKKGMKTIRNKFFKDGFNFDHTNDIVWDSGIMKNELKIHHLNKSFFLPFNFNFYSSKDIKPSFYCHDSYKILDYYFKKQIN